MSDRRNKPRSSVLRGRRWAIAWRSQPDCWGSCDHARRRLLVHPTIAGHDLLEVAMHEAMHACLPDLAEPAVDQTSADISRFLWRLMPWIVGSEDSAS